ncbi:TetR/AcrR family transcriptional regulator [Paenibacillus sp. S25]|uniref:TetR/AcrR family transcriptional regulator n=1 Tax=unclassified Paenibacillus TaxID=185978 RepID=UPI001C650DE2|nr:TetR/AcrR family transcriptional regulator [Paenibacillus sp. S25]QYK60652.1 Bacterial regulatory protein, tetR family [Paenibacillus sp. S25]
MQDKAMNDSLKKLLEIAEEMIMEKGCRATTLQDIADRSGLTKGAIYHYVKSKDELFGMILEAGMEKTNQRFFESVARTPAGPEGIKSPLNTLTERLRNIGSGNSATSLIFIYLLSQQDKPAVAGILKRYHEASILTAKTWIEVGQQNGAIPISIDADRTARMFTVFKNGLQVQHNIVTDGDKINELEIYEFLMNALGGAGRG